jgi:uncharacterized membrane protein
MCISWKIAAPENVVSGLLAPLAGAGRHEPGLVSRRFHGNTHEIMERDTRQTRHEEEQSMERVYENTTEARRTVTVDKPRGEVYRFWRNLENLPKIMNRLESVKILSPDRSH